MATLQTLTYRFTLDAFKNGVQRIIHGYEIGETAARKMEISLMYGINTYELPLGNITASMYVKRPSDTDPSINACIIDAENNKIIYEMQDSDIAEAGIVNMQLKVFDNDKILISPQFGIDVWESLIDDSSASESPSYTALTTALAQAKAYNDKAITDVVVEDDLTFVVSFADGTEYTSDALKDAAATFEDYSLESEAWSKGTKDGVPVTSSAPQYNNHSKHYSEVSLGYANQSNGYANQSAGYRDQSQVYRNESQLYANNSKAYRNQSQGYANESHGWVSEAEKWSKGTADDVPVSPTDPTYHNNSKYWADGAEDAKDDASASATLSQSWAIGGTSTRSGEDTNNSKHFAQQAADTVAELLSLFGVSVVGTKLVFGVHFEELYDIEVVGTQLRISNKA